ncbi:hypothetical protein ACFX5Q_17520, partial [Mesorhizobium sp. IMUNJ 23033]|uniref:hypothetical protein n=1 Tax=Mesorhizobium sp. IMUNJ 23033 TaxID=3378039 RepID=UPI00384DD386
NVSRRVDGVNLKNALGQIKAHGGNLHGGWLLSSGCLTANPLWTVMPGAGAIHLICFREAAKPISTTYMRRKAARL